MIRSLNDPRRLLVVGQIRGRYDTFEKVVGRAHVEKAEGIVALGNLFERGTESDAWRFLEHMDSRLSTFNLPLWFVDGPSDPHPLLGKGAGLLSDWVTCWPRGENWGWGGVRFMAMGGGVTLHRNDRPPPSVWWPQESITAAEVESAVEAARPVDVLFCHELPWPVQLPGAADPIYDPGFDRADRAALVEARKTLKRVCERVRPRQVLSGAGFRANVELLVDRRFGRVDVAVLGDPDTGDGCEVLAIQEESPLRGAHPALGVSEPPPEVEVQHPAL